MSKKAPQKGPSLILTIHCSRSLRVLRLGNPLFRATSQWLICPSCLAPPCGQACQLLIASAISSSGTPCSRALPKWVFKARVAVRANRCADGDQFTDSVIKLHMVLSPFSLQTDSALKGYGTGDLEMAFNDGIASHLQSPSVKSASIGE